MLGYSLRRLIHLLPLWLALTAFAFLLGEVAPGDLTYDLARRQFGGDVEPTPAQVEALRQELGLDRSAPVRYADWLTDAIRGDLGRSFFTGRPVSEALGQALPVTARLAGSALILTLVLGVGLGIVAALYRGGPADHLLRALGLAGTSMPGYWKAYLLVSMFAVSAGWFPTQGLDHPRAFALPSVSLALGSAAVLMRLTRSAVLEALGADHVLAARARGYRRWRVVVRHTLRSALNPVLTSAGLLAGGLLGGAVVIETVFSMPGLGKLVVDAANTKDYPVVQGFALYLGSIVLLVNLAIDLLYVVVDPRVSYVSPQPEPVGAGG
ncbi:MAG: ABC transporter permease [Acidimicrobiales bacterium]